MRPTETSKNGAVEEDALWQEIRPIYPKLLLAAKKRITRAGVAYDPVDVVQTALLALIDGKCPVDVPIEAFLRVKILNIVGNAARHHDRFPELNIEYPSDWGQLLVDLPVAESLEEKRIATEVLSVLYETACEADDAEIALMLDEYRLGVHKRADLAIALGISPRAVDAARKRLKTLCNRLPKELKASVKEVFGLSI